ncbi:hypothetical protein D3C86_2173090 [compost metagenome]
MVDVAVFSNAFEVSFNNFISDDFFRFFTDLFNIFVFTQFDNFGEKFQPDAIADTLRLYERCNLNFLAFQNK